ncbi:MAG: hypothetical protein ACRDFQ_06565 [Anaerolineales bacterium]
MGRVIRTENISTQRNRLMKALALALRELGKQLAFGTESRDLAAFIVLALDEVAETVERSVQPWEKRDYWVKADRFRMEWAWVAPIAKEMRVALIAEDAGGVAAAAARLAPRLREIEVPERHRLGTPWVGALEKFQELQK